MDGDRLLGTPVDTGQAMAAMRTYNCLLSCTNNITDWTDTGTKAAGNPEPSHEDIVVTQRIADAGQIMEIPVLDHIIIGDGTFVSLCERGYV